MAKVSIVSANVVVIFTVNGLEELVFVRFVVYLLLINSVSNRLVPALCLNKHQ
jgi:hypothetical protein